ncbi:MAG: hypothetical protein K2Y21_02000 [Phycisphaerales bacterium]|nr:hypothetical protein [Phycisphaerales bacterium]
MFGRSLAGLVVLIVVLSVGWVNIYWHRSQVNEDYRKEFHRLIEKCDGYGGNKEYFDWLVDSTHDEVFNDSYKIKTGTGRRGMARDESTFDEERYFETMIDGMIAKAKNDKADQVVKSIEAMVAKLEKEAQAEAEAEAKAEAARSSPGASPQRR